MAKAKPVITTVRSTITSVEYTNVRALRAATLPLNRLTVLIGPNGSGKSTAVRALRMAAAGTAVKTKDWASVASLAREAAPGVAVKVDWGGPHAGRSARWVWGSGVDVSAAPKLVLHPHDPETDVLAQSMKSMRIYSFSPDAIAAPVALKEGIDLQENGSQLAGVFDNLRDEDPEAFERVNEELPDWLPEFDRILFETPQQGTRTVVLRTRVGGYKIPAGYLSAGTLMALALIALTYSPRSPMLLALEEPERGLHPRLLAQVRDALYRATSSDRGDAARQIIVTTHSPYLLDAFRDHPEDIMIAQKADNDVTFERLIDRPDVHTILSEVQLGDAWYSGVLGGQPVPK
jgi:predicted ATPase